MSTQVRARIRTAGAVLALSLSASACGQLDGGSGAQLPPALVQGKPAGTVTVAAGVAPDALVKGLQDAITADGGAVLAVVDHAATARDAGVQIPPNTVVIGGPDPANLAFVQAKPTAGVNLPPPYQVRQDASGSTVLAYDSPEYLAAISGIEDPAVRAPLTEASTAIVGRAAPGAPAGEAAPLVGVTPVDFLLTVAGSTTVAGTVNLLQRAAGRGGNKFIAAADFVPEQARPRAGGGNPALPAGAPRPTSVVLVSRPAAEAPLLSTAPTIGLDLPMRFVIWIDDQNITQIGYPDIRRIAVRHGIPADDPNVVALAAEADRLSRVAAGIVQ